MLPHSKHARWKGGVYCVYGAEAVEVTICWNGGMSALRDRQRLCAMATDCTRLAHVCREKRTLRWQFEEQLHRRVVFQRAC